MKSARSFVSIVILMTTLPLVGCGSAATEYAGPLVPVKGIVRYKGQPLIKGTVTFEPNDIGREAHGEIQPDGTFVISTFKAGDGAAPGLFRVGIDGNYKPGKFVPVKYRNATSSKLEADVSAEKGEFTFDLK